MSQPRLLLLLLVTVLALLSCACRDCPLIPPRFCSGPTPWSTRLWRFVSRAVSASRAPSTTRDSTRRSASRRPFEPPDCRLRRARLPGLRSSARTSRLGPGGPRRAGGGCAGILGSSVFGPVGGWIAGSAWSFWPDVLRRATDPAEWWLAESLSVPLVIFALAALSFPCQLETSRPSAAFFWESRCLCGLIRHRCCRSRWSLASRCRAGADALSVPGSYSSFSPRFQAWHGRRETGFASEPSLASQSGVALWVGNNETARGSSRGGWWESPEFPELVSQHPEILTAPKAKVRDLHARSDRIRARAWPHAVRVAGGAQVRTLPLPDRRRLGIPARRRGGSPSHAVRAPNTLAPPVPMETTFLVTLVAGTLVTVLICFHESRYRFTAMPAFVIVASLGLVHLGELLGADAVSQPMSCESPPRDSSWDRRRASPLRAGCPGR